MRFINLLVALFVSIHQCSLPCGWGDEVVFPGNEWTTKSAQELGLDDAQWEEVAKRLGSRGCAIKNGYVVKAWGSQDQRSDWFSSAKPVLSTLLMFAVKEGKIASFDQRVVEFDWPLVEKDQPMTFRHLASMTSGYARPEPPGAAWAYNDFAIQLYQKTLFDKVFQSPPEETFHHPQRFGALGLQDGFHFRQKNRRMTASVRDFARVAWFWLNRGNWNGVQLLPRAYFDGNMRGQVPRNLPLSSETPTNDYLQIGSYGGDSNHFTTAGPGIYGFNWWFNDVGGKHPDVVTWPDAPRDVVMSLGHRGNCCVMIPSLNVVVVAADANWGELKPGRADAGLNQTLKLIAKAATPRQAIDVSGFRDGIHHWRKIRDPKRVIHALPDQPSYAVEQVKEIAANILLFQRANGGWPKDYDMLAVLTPEQVQVIRETYDRNDTSFDNYNVHSQVDYLARAYAAGGDKAWREACERGFDFILSAQLPGGGFPQQHPEGSGYSRFITFNDGVTMGALTVLQDAAEEAPQWEWLDKDRRQAATKAVEAGLKCILSCQIEVDGVRTGWCQQHDPETLTAAPARSFELASICPQETTAVIRFLMRRPHPSKEVVQAIDDAVTWLRETQLSGIRVERVAAETEKYEFHTTDFDVVVIADDNAKPIWARHYEIGTNRPVFAGRDTVKRYALSEIARERRTGTPWYGDWPLRLLETEYPEWQASRSGAQ